jgi:hypothetical protein
MIFKNLDLWKQNYVMLCRSERADHPISII